MAIRPTSSVDPNEVNAASLGELYHYFGVTPTEAMAMLDQGMTILEIQEHQRAAYQASQAVKH